MLVDQTNGMESVGDNPGSGEPLANEPAVRAGEVDTNEPDLVPSFESSKEGSELFLAPARMDIEDAMVLQVAEGGAEALSFVQGMLVDAQIQGAVQADALFGLTDGKLLVDPADGGLPELLAPAQGARADTLLVLLVDVVAKGFGAVAVGPHPGKLGHEALTATGALQTPCMDD